MPMLISPSNMKKTETELLLTVHHTSLDLHGPHCFYVKFEMVVTSLWWFEVSVPAAEAECQV